MVAERERWIVRKAGQVAGAPGAGVVRALAPAVLVADMSLLKDEKGKRKDDHIETLKAWFGGTAITEFLSAYLMAASSITWGLLFYLGSRGVNILSEEALRFNILKREQEESE